MCQGKGNIGFLRGPAPRVPRRAKAQPRWAVSARAGCRGSGTRNGHGRVECLCCPEDGRFLSHLQSSCAGEAGKDRERGLRTGRAAVGHWASRAFTSLSPSQGRAALSHGRCACPGPSRGSFRCLGPCPLRPTQPPASRPGKLRERTCAAVLMKVCGGSCPHTPETPTDGRGAVFTPRPCRPERRACWFSGEACDRLVLSTEPRAHV